MEDDSSMPTYSLLIEILSLTSISDKYSGKEIHDGFTFVLSSSLDNGQPLKRDVSFIRKSTKEISINDSESRILFSKLSQISLSSFTITIVYSDDSSTKKLWNNIQIGKEETQSIIVKDLHIELLIKIVIETSNGKARISLQRQSFPIKKIIIPQIIPLKTTLLEEVVSTNYFECFFIAGLSRFNHQTAISNSSLFKSQCGHHECSNHPSYSPSVVYSFIKKSNANIDLNEYTSKLCFPLGIKLCYNTTDHCLNNKTFIHNVITGGKGSHYYLTALMFYIEFPIDSFPNYFPDIELMIKQNTKVKSVLLPFCFCLMSACYDPITTKEILLMLLNDYQRDTSFDQDILHLIYEIPSLPSLNSTMTVYFPKTQVRLRSINSIELNNIFINEIILRFDNEALTIILSSLLIENKVILVSNDHSLLYEISLGLKAMIYPFKWRGTFIPLITEDSVKYTQSFIPFIMGIDRTIFTNALQLKLFNNESDILIIDIDNKSISLLTPNAIITQYNKETIKNEIANYPISDYLNSKLLNKSNMSKEDIKDCLLKAISKLLINYQSYISFVGSNVLFNQTCFVSSIDNANESYSHFYSELTSTQQFNEFLQEHEKEEFKHFNSLCVVKEKNGHSIDTLSNNDDDAIKGSIHNNDNWEGNGDCVDNDYNLFPFFFKVTKHYYSNKTQIESDIKNYYNSLKDNNNDNTDFIDFVLFEDAFIRFDLIFKNTHPKELRLYNCLIDQEENNNSDSQSLSSSQARVDTVENDNNNNTDNGNKPLRNSNRSIRSSTASKTNKSVPYRKTISLVNMVLHSNTFKEIEKYQEQICELLRDYMGYVLINKQLPLLNSISDFSLCFSKSIIRQEFAFIIFQDKFRQGYEHELINSIYDHFGQMVFYVFLNTKDTQIEYENVRLITKSLFYYFTWKDTNAKEYLFVPIVKHGIVFPFWMNKLFWEYYFKEELISHPLENINSKNNIVKTMIQLNIDNKFIDYCKMKVFKC